MSHIVTYVTYVTSEMNKTQKKNEHNTVRMVYTVICSSALMDW